MQLGPQDAYMAGCLSRLATNLDRQERHAEAEPLHQRALEIQRASSGNHPYTGRVAFLASENLASLGQSADACKLAREAREILSARLPPTHKWIQQATDFLSMNCQDSGLTNQ
jgi:hypothetical protein